VELLEAERKVSSSELESKRLGEDRGKTIAIKMMKRRVVELFDWKTNGMLVWMRWIDVLEVIVAIRMVM